MGNMKNKNLIEYLQDVFELEKQKTIAEKTIEYIERKYQIAQNNFEGGKSVYKRKMSGGQFACLGICMYSLLVAGGGIWALSNPNITADKTDVYIMLFLAVIFGGVFVNSYKKMKNDETVVNTLNKTIGEKGENDMHILEANYQIIKEAYDINKKTLEKLYSLNIIYHKYHYLEACGMFLEYLISGRTHSLEAQGSDPGAYNIYEDELYRGIIVDKLDNILSNQCILIDGQRQISKQLDFLTKGIDEVQKEMKGVKKAAQLNTFYNSVTAYNTSVLRKISEQRYYSKQRNNDLK
ncbi:hypothetical protein BRYFOR_09431 [Marvinbryantia formatexigens DSM 14469]|uniref:Uncharacterized protein n=2 Tax=Marvinbryantia TaxID=248744 RepID=C6LL84_9FIRM|nr:hypothetical protein BRYFOR_09431 [Marvinbryantia formatexigens DSM 14469]